MYVVGKEEVGIADIKVANWPLVDSTSFEALFAPCCIDDGSDGRCVGVGDKSTFFDTTTRRCISPIRTREPPLHCSLASTSMPLSPCLAAASAEAKLSVFF